MIFDYLDQGVLIGDSTGRPILANAAAARIFGFQSVDELIAASPDSFTSHIALYDEQADPLCIENVLRATENGDVNGQTAFVLSRSRETGEARWYRVRTRSIPDGSNARTLDISVWEDITERRTAAEHTRLLAAIVATSDDAIVSKTLDGAVTSWNRAAERLYGWSAEEMIGQSIARVVPPDKLEELSAILARLGRGEIVEHHETTRVRRDGTVIDVSVSISPILDADGRVIGAAKIGRNITVRREAERFADAFLADLAHDVNNPLATAQIQAQLLRRRIQRDPSDSVAIENALASVESSIAKVVRRISELSDVTRLRLHGALELALKDVDLVALVSELVQSNPLRDRVIFHSSQPHILGYWDAQRLERVFDNLLSNALKYSEQNCLVEVHLENRDDGAPSTAVVTVTDFGVGIPQSDLPYIFDRFRRGSNVVGRIAGTGIGLTGTRQIVELHGGEISIKSKPGAGTTVRVQLPISSRSHAGKPRR